MERGSDQRFFIFSSQEQTGREARAPHNITGGPAGSQPGGPQMGILPGRCCAPSIKEQLVGTAATIYWIKTGYSGAILRYVNERYIIDIY